MNEPVSTCSKPVSQEVRAAVEAERRRWESRIANLLAKAREKPLPMPRPKGGRGDE